MAKILQRAREKGGTVHDHRVFTSIEDCRATQQKVINTYIQRGSVTREDVIQAMPVLFKDEKPIGITTHNTYYYLTCIPARPDWVAYIQMSMYD